VSEGRRARGEGRKENPDQFSNRVLCGSNQFPKDRNVHENAPEGILPPTGLSHSTIPTFQHSNIPTFQHSNISSLLLNRQTAKRQRTNRNTEQTGPPAGAGVTFASTTGRLPATISGGSAVNFQMPIERCFTQERSRTPHRRHPSMQWVEIAAHPFTHPSITSADLASACQPSPWPMSKRTRKRPDARVWSHTRHAGEVLASGTTRCRPDSRLQTPDSGLRTPDSGLRTHRPSKTSIPPRPEGPSTGIRIGCALDHRRIDLGYPFRGETPSKCRGHATPQKL
jgi:hypothetical protein